MRNIERQNVGLKELLEGVMISPMFVSDICSTIDFSFRSKKGMLDYLRSYFGCNVLL